MYPILELVLEMNERGINFLPVDIKKSDATKFLVEEEGIRPPFSALSGFGEVDAKSSEKIIKDVVKANDLSEDDDMYSVEINDIIWYIAGYESDDKVVYYNSFESENIPEKSKIVLSYREIASFIS